MYLTVIQVGTGLRTFVLKNFIKISLIIKECPEEILTKQTVNCPEDFKV